MSLCLIFQSSAFCFLVEVFSINMHKMVRAFELISPVAYKQGYIILTL